MKDILILLLLISKMSYSQTREGLSVLQKKMIKNDINQYNLSNLLVNPKYDSSILLHYKSAIYFIATHNDSICIWQNIVIDKLNNPKSRKIIKHIIKSKIVFDGDIDSSIIDRVTFKSLYNLGELAVLNNPRIKSNTITPNSDNDDYYTSTYLKGQKTDEFKISAFWINDPSIIINGWHLKRLILQLYLNYNHWLIVDSEIKKSGAGYYVLNNQIDDNMIYYYDGKGNFIENYSKHIWKKYFPTQFVAPDKIKPQNKYPLLPILPEGAMFKDS